MINMEIPQRKLNRLSEYDYGQEGVYFVTLCTQNRSRLFQMELPVGNGLCAVPDGVGVGNGTTHRSCPAAGNAIIHKWVQETENKFPNIAIDKYVIMPDHLHLIVTIKERHAGRSLPDVMRFFKNKEGRLPDAPGRIWYEADLNYYSGKRNNHRLLWSNDGLFFVTYDHYESFMEVLWKFYGSGRRLIYEQSKHCNP